jgi:hypothetical protein
MSGLKNPDRFDTRLFSIMVPDGFIQEYPAESFPVERAVPIPPRWVGWKSSGYYRPTYSFQDNQGTLISTQ